MDIRLYKDTDRDAVRDVIVPIQREEFGIDISYDDQPDLKDIEGFYMPGAGGFWLAVVDDEVVGTIALKDIGNGEAALRKMFVKPAFRGREHRVAQKLLDHLISHARGQGLKIILLGTTAQFLAAHRFYEKNRFELVDVTDLPATFPRMVVDTRFYRLVL